MIVPSRSSQDDSIASSNLFIFVAIGFGIIVMSVSLYLSWRKSNNVQNEDRRDVDRSISDQSISFSNNVGDIYDDFNVDVEDDDLEDDDLDNEYMEPVVMEGTDYDEAVDGVGKEHMYHEAANN
tara:strand:+ start:123 stop:494 length:372 start_codon:yes stop_codon:yes gene_type:complete